jgi:hypothetical protein
LTDFDFASPLEKDTTRSLHKRGSIITYFDPDAHDGGDFRTSDPHLRPSF